MGPSVSFPLPLRIPIRNSLELRYESESYRYRYRFFYDFELIREVLANTGRMLSLLSDYTEQAMS